jgi:hypothetical protein
MRTIGPNGGAVAVNKPGGKVLCSSGRLRRDRLRTWAQTALALVEGSAPPSISPVAKRLGHQTGGPRSFWRTLKKYRATSHGRRGSKSQQQIASGVFDPRQNPQPNERSLWFCAQHYRCPDWFIRHSFVLRHCCSEGRAHQTLRSRVMAKKKNRKSKSKGM